MNFNSNLPTLVFSNLPHQGLVFRMNRTRLKGGMKGKRDSGKRRRLTWSKTLMERSQPKTYMDHYSMTTFQLSHVGKPGGENQRWKTCLSISFFQRRFTIVIEFQSKKTWKQKPPKYAPLLRL